MRESFVVHAEYIEDLPEELKTTFLRYVYDYGINSIEPNLSGLELTVWLKIKHRIDKDTAAYDRRVANLKQNKHRTETERETIKADVLPNGDRTETERETINNTVSRTGGVLVNDTVNELVLDSVNVGSGEPIPPTAKAPKTKRFTKPSLEEIREYCFEKNINIDSEKFFNYYESKGWKVGTAPMKDWKAAVRNWAKNDIQYQQNKVPKGIQSDKDTAILERYKPEEDKNNEDILKNLAEIQGGTNGVIQPEEEIIF